MPFDEALESATVVMCARLPACESPVSSYEAARIAATCAGRNRSSASAERASSRLPSHDTRAESMSWHSDLPRRSTRRILESAGPRPISSGTARAMTRLRESQRLRTKSDHTCHISQSAAALPVTRLASTPTREAPKPQRMPRRLKQLSTSYSDAGPRQCWLGRWYSKPRSRCDQGVQRGLVPIRAGTPRWRCQGRTGPR